MSAKKILFYIVAGIAIIITVLLVDAVTDNVRSVAGGLVATRNDAEQTSLMNCPGSPNCVSSYPESGYADLSPWEYGEHSRNQARDALLNTLDELPRTEIQTVQDNYIHAVHRSELFRFRDDLEFHLPADENHIDFRAASRVGTSDLGVHEERMTRLREVFSHYLANSP